MDSIDPVVDLVVRAPAHSDYPGWIKGRKTVVHSVDQSLTVSNQIDRFVKAPLHQSSGAPNIMTLNRDKKRNILNKSKNKKEKRRKPEQGMWII